MRRQFVATLLYIFALHTAMGQGPFSKEEVVASHFLREKRAIHIHLPPSYLKEPHRRFPVLYLQDGQNTFSTAGTNVAFGWGSWELDETADGLARSNKMQEIILVAIDNSLVRFAEYNGSVNQTNSPTPFENYADFLVIELKPRIDREYRTRPDAAHTGVMGSSLGGICSVALAWEHPDVFGRAASLSGAFQVDQTNFLRRVLHNYRGKPKPIRVYLDSGTVDFTGGDDNRALTEEVYRELRRIDGKSDLEHFVDDKPLKAAKLEKTGLRRDKWAEAETSQHNEFYWRLRSWRALTFLFPPDVK